MVGGGTVVGGLVVGGAVVAGAAVVVGALVVTGAEAATTVVMVGGVVTRGAAVVVTARLGGGGGTGADAGEAVGSEPALGFVGSGRMVAVARRSRRSTPNVARSGASGVGTGAVTSASVAR